jgi:hypothetical protein
MRKITIKDSEYKWWTEDTFRDYASCSISDKGLLKRLRFSVSLAGEFQVKYGNKVLYQGYDFELAKKHFHGVQDERK